MNSYSCKSDFTQTYVAAYDAWGKQTITKNTLNLRRGYCQHEHWNEFGLIDMNGRFYDPQLGRFLSPDPYVQAPNNPQNFNRYSYCLNNPLKYTDPSGEFCVGAVIAGAIIGLYMGGTLANKSYNPIKWDYGSGQTWRYMGYGAIVGAASGYVGAEIAASGCAFANTTSIAMSSLINSVGTAAYTNGQTNIGISFGAFSIDLTNNKLGFIGKKGNKTIENVGYGLGALANVSDVLMGLSPQKVDLVTEHSDGVGHSAIVEHGTTTGGSYEIPDPNGIISVGPDYDVNGAKGTWHYTHGKNTWNTYSNGSANHPIWRETLRVNLKTINKYADFINQKVTAGTFRYSVEFSSCVTHTSIALNLSGIVNIGIHPYLLHAQMYLRNIGFRPCLYSYLIQ